MPIAKPTSVCPSSLKNTDLSIISKASKKLYINGMMVAVFVLIFLLCCWFVGKNAVAIYTVVTEWRANVRATHAERSKGFYQDLTNPALDDESYPATRDHEDIRSENELIRRKIAKVKKQYREYNRALAKSGKPDAVDDAVNEDILDETRDEYHVHVSTDGSSDV